jgi:hypothetical protein
MGAVDIPEQSITGVVDRMVGNAAEDSAEIAFVFPPRMSASDYGEPSGETAEGPLRVALSRSAEIGGLSQ